MGVCARERFSASRLVLAIVALVGVTSQTLAAPADVVTSSAVRTPVPGFQTPITINLRAQGVVTGSPSLTLGDPTFLTNGQPTEFVLEARLLTGTTPGAVCIQLVNRDFTFSPNNRYSLALTASNADGRDAGTVDVVFSSGGGPVTSPTDPACGDPNRAPTAAIAGGNRTITDTNGAVGEPVAFVGTGTDPEGDTLTYQWFLNSDQTPVATGATPTISLPDGTTRVRLRVIDEAGATSPDATVSITVSPPVNQRPNAFLSDMTVNDTDGAPGESVLLDGSESNDPDPNGRIVSYAWSNSEGPLVTTTTPTTRVTLPDGANLITLTVTDNGGLTGTDTATIQVNPPRLPPVANAGADRAINDTNGQPGESVALDGRGSSDADGTVVAYSWRNAAGAQIATGPTPTLSLPDGTHQITLVVTDNTQLVSAPDTVQIIVRAPQAPNANAGPDQSVPDSNGVPGETVALSGSASTDADGTIASYVWSIAGAQVGTGATLSRAFTDGVTDVTLTVTDNVGLTDTDTVRITVAAPAPRPPVANAGPDQTLPDTNGAPGETVTLSGSASTDPDGTIATYVWSSGGTQLGTGVTLTRSFPDGVTDVTLTVTDNVGLTATDTVRITVTAPARPPVANAGPDQTLPDSNGAPGESVTLSGSASTDPDGTIATYVWSSGSTQLGTGVTLTRTFADGVTDVTLTVTDNAGLSDTDTVRVTIAPPNAAPTADAGDDRTVPDSDQAPGELVTLIGRGTDSDGRIVSYEWRSGDALLGRTPTIQVRLPDGPNVVTLIVTDDDGDTGEATVQIAVTPPDTPDPQPPTANAGADQTIVDTNGDAGEPVTLTGTASDPDGRVVRYEWFRGESLLGTGATLTTTLADGVHTITLIVTDDSERTGSDTVQITVNAPRPPTANAGADQTLGDTDGADGELVSLTGSGTDPDGTIATYEWTEGEGTLGTGATLQRRLSNGVHTVTLTVTDNVGLRASDTVQITISAASAPTANAGADQTLSDTDRAAGEIVSLSGSATDPDGTIASYQWFIGETVLGTGATLQARIPDGVNTVTLRVTDNTGLTDTDTVQITVAAPALPPTANAGPDQTLADSDGAAGELVSLTGTGSDPDGTIASYQWFNGETSLGTTASLQTRLADGVSTLTLRVTDNTGLTATDTVQITVTAPAQPPTANAGADQSLTDTDGQPGENVTLTGSGTDPDGTIATYQWLNGQTVLGSGATLTARIPDGVSTITLRVTDNVGLTASDTLQVTIAAPVLPVVNAGGARTVEDTDLETGETVQLTGSATTNVGTITGYQWFLGETSLGSGASISARLPDGVNIVTLRVTNSLNLTGTATVQITVAVPVRAVLSNIPGLTPNEQRLATKLDEACNRVLGPITGGSTTERPPTETKPRAPTESKPRPPTEDEVSDFRQKCRGLLASRDTAALRGAMGELLGDDFSAARTQTLLFSNTLYASVMDRLIALRGGAKGLSLAGLNIVVDGELIPLAELQDLAKELFGGGASSDADLWSDKWGVWMRGNYSFGDKGGDELSPSFDADQYAMMAGVDYRLTQSAVIGAALAYGDSSVNFNPVGEGSLKTESWALSMYGSVYAKKNFYFDAIVNLADSGYQAERNITYVDGFGLVSAGASGDTGGLTMSGGLSGGYDFLVGGLTLSPTIGVFYIDATIDEFTETGARGLNLIYDEQNFKSFTGTLGVRATFAWNLPFGVLLPHFRADYVREFEDDVDVFGIRFASDPNATSAPPILVETENADTSYWRLAAGFSAQFQHGFSGYVEYQRLESFEFINFSDVSFGLRYQASF